MKKKLLGTFDFLVNCFYATPFIATVIQICISFSIASEENIVAKKGNRYNDLEILRAVRISLYPSSLQMKLEFYFATKQASLVVTRLNKWAYVL